MRISFQIPWIKLLLINFTIFSIGFLYGVIAGKTNLLDTFNPIDLSAAKILKNNFIVICLMLTAGLLTFGTMAMLIIFINGIIVGETIIAVYQKSGISPLLSGLLPHFIPELGAILFSGAITLLPIFFLLQQKQIKIKYFYIETIFILIIVVLLLTLAGIIEGNFSYLS